MSERVLITGAAGLVGGILMRGLRDELDVTGVDVAAGDAPGVHRLDVRDTVALEPLLRRCDAVVHLAERPGAELSWEEVHANNLLATWSVLQAAARAGVSRVVYASSNYVVAGHELADPWASVLEGRYAGLDPGTLPRIDATVAPRPDSAYAVGKVFGEAACRHAADVYGLSALCLRIGTVKGEDRPSKARHYAKLLTHRDLVGLVGACLRAPSELRFATFYGTSANTWRIYDIDAARAAIGYAPSDDAESMRPALASA
ncbi:MAG TPA: NAD(P)-dependent oxidoreductase [Solirubrobacteraceae bacterium]|jgi:nucleoside-diphosphate-sugar epimerase